MAKTLQQRLVAAIVARGYVEQTNPRSRRYVELVVGGECRPLLGGNGVVSSHRILVGKAGALRYTRGSISDSYPFTDAMKTRLISEHEAAEGREPK